MRGDHDVRGAVRALALTVLLACLVPPPAQAAQFECTLAGLNAAFAAADAGDPGPHQLACVPGDRIAFDRTAGEGIRTATRDIDLDGGGVTVECRRTSYTGPSCYPALTFGPPYLCNDPPRCWDRTPGVPPVVRLARFRFAKMGLQAITGTDLTLDLVVVEENVIPPPVSSEPNRPGVGLAAFSPLDRGEPPVRLRVVDSTIHHGVELANAVAEVERSLLHISIQDSTTGSVAFGLYVDENSDAAIANSTVQGGIGSVGGLDLRSSTVVGTDYDGRTGSALLSDYAQGDPMTGCVVSSSRGDISFSNSIVVGGCYLQPTLVFDPFPDDETLCDVPADIPPPVSIASFGGNLQALPLRDLCPLIDPTDLVAASAEELGFGPLADNGGPSPTYALLEGSIAIDTAVSEECLPVDQRGVARPQGAGCDRGAFEVPEPRAALLASSALGTLAWLRRRRVRSPRFAPHSSQRGASSGRGE